MNAEQDTNDIDADASNTETNDSAPEAQDAPRAPAPRKAAKVKARKEKAPPAPKVEWQPPDDVIEACSIMQRYAKLGDKKACAYFVTTSIECRATAKDVRDSLTNVGGDASPPPQA